MTAQMVTKVDGNMTVRELQRLSLESLVDVKTLRRFFADKPVREATRLRIEKAMAALGIEAPPSNGRNGR